MLSIHSKPPNYLGSLGMLVVILRRQRPSLLAYNLATAAFAAINTGMVWRSSWIILLVKGFGPAIGHCNIGLPFVQRHLRAPFLFDADAKIGPLRAYAH